MVLTVSRKGKKDSVESLSQQFMDCLNRESNLERRISKMSDSPEKAGMEKWLKSIKETQREQIRIRMYESINNS
jgi:hypothetical protein